MKKSRMRKNEREERERDRERERIRKKEHVRWDGTRRLDGIPA